MSENEGFSLDDLCTDENLEVEGIWRDFGKGARAKIARWQNSEFQKMMRRKYKSNRVILEQEDDVADKVSTDVLIEVMAHTILKGMEGFRFKGKAIDKYTPAIGIEVLKIKDFRDKIRGFAEDMQSYRTKQEDDAVNA